MTIEEGQEIIKNNLKVLQSKKLYKYKAIVTLLNGDNRMSITPRQFIYKVFNYVKDKELIEDLSTDNRVFYLSTDRIMTAILKNPYHAKANRYINFLCAMGLIRKVKQPKITADGKNIYQELKKYNEVNRSFLFNNLYADTPINCFYVVPYTDEELNRIEERARRLIDNKLKTPGIKWNCDILIQKGLNDIAEEVYYNNVSALERKKNVYDLIVSIIEMCIDTKGYATKEDIYNNSGIKDSYIDMVLRTYEDDLKQHYIKRSPIAQEKEQFDIDKINRKHIFLRREKEQWQAKQEKN